MNTQLSVSAFITHDYLKRTKYIHWCDEICICSNMGINSAVCIKWIDETLNNRLLSVPNCYEVVAMVATCGRYACAIVMSYTEMNKAVPQWRSNFNLCVSVTWPLTCAFHIPCKHTPEIIDMFRGVCDNRLDYMLRMGIYMRLYTYTICNFSSWLFNFHHDAHVHFLHLWSDS